MSIKFDYIVVGAGSAGCVIANRLSKNQNNTVCIIEAGPKDWSPLIHIPAGFMYNLKNKKYNDGEFLHQHKLPICLSKKGKYLLGDGLLDIKITAIVDDETIGGVLAPRAEAGEFD